MANKQTTYFDLFQLPTSLPVDIAQLNQQYQLLQRQYHPDNFALADETTRVAKLQYSAYINDAYQTLKDPLRSAEYLLAQQGIDASGESTIHDPQFLMNQFLLRERLELLQQDSDPAVYEAELLDFAAEVKQLWQTSYHQLLTTIETKDWAQAQQLLNQLRYLQKLKQQIQQLKEQLLDL